MRRPARAILLMMACAALLVGAQPALALSEIKREELPPAAPPAPPAVEDGENAVPMPDPVPAPGQGDDIKTGPTVPGAPAGPPTPGAPTEPATPGDPPGAGTGGQTDDGTASDPNAPLPEVSYDISQLPEPVRRMRDLILEACRSGDPEKLRMLLGSGDSMTQLSVGEFDGDPIAFLKELSGDPEGLEILAIMEEVLQAGYVHLDAGTDEELYVWPYFFAVPLDRLTAPQKVELFKLITAGDYEEMSNYGSYIFYRAGITPEGKWAFFVAGE